jgi:hypothetical protein
MNGLIEALEPVAKWIGLVGIFASALSAALGSEKLGESVHEATEFPKFALTFASGVFYVAPVATGTFVLDKQSGTFRYINPEPPKLTDVPFIKFLVDTVKELPYLALAAALGGTVGWVVSYALRARRGKSSGPASA